MKMERIFIRASTPMYYLEIRITLCLLPILALLEPCRIRAAKINEVTTFEYPVSYDKQP